jgi:membrane protein DedA with SNARE-associated domain
LLILLMVIAVVVGSIRTPPVSATAGLAGTAIAAVSALIGAMAAFWIARFFGKHSPDNPLLARDGSQRFLTITIVRTRL